TTRREWPRRGRVQWLHLPGSPPTAARRAPTHVLVVNQHGDNTGDEAAIRGMLDGLAEQIGDARFTVLHQFRERSSEVDTGHDVRWIPLVLPPLEAVRLVLYSLLQLLGVRSEEHTSELQSREKLVCR